MTVIRLRQRGNAEPGGWRREELRELEAIFAAFVRYGDAVEYALGATERGEPQFYVLAPEPDCECILSISRVGRVYLVEDGAGMMIERVADLKQLADEGPHIVERRHRSLLAKGVSAWCAARTAIEERIEPLLAEPVEVLSHIAPQLAALA